MFLILHPFLWIDPEGAHEIDIQDAGFSRRQLRDWVHPGTWQEIVTLLGLSDFAQLNRLLLMSIGAIKNTDPGTVENFRQQLEQRHLMMSDEGELPEILIDEYLRSIRTLGFEEVVVGDEFARHRTTHRIDALLGAEYPYLHEAHATLYPPDESLLYCSHWDSFYTFLCGSRERVDSIVSKFGFEGFWADEETRVYWLG